MIKEIENEDKLSKLLILILLGLFVSMVFHEIWISFTFSEYEGYFQNFATVFISIILEAMPFIMLGAFISGLLQVFISEEFIVKMIPKNKFLGIFLAGLMGFIFPVCECAIVPITRRLIKKGVPINIAVTFMLAVPLVNPVVLLSTYYAFYNKPSMVFIRGIVGFLTAIIIGFLMGYVEEGKVVLKNNDVAFDNQCNCGCGNQAGYNKNKSKILSVLDHTSAELYSIGRYLIIGALMSAAFQTFVSKTYLLSLGQRSLLSIVILMLLAFVISICSSADAFIAKTFLNQFTIGAIVAFLILGPMIDIKNTLMLSGAFKKTFVAELIICIFFICFIIGCAFNIIDVPLHN